MGDANLDGRIDMNDLTKVLTNYNQSGMKWGQGDFNGDGKVDINDLTVVLTNYNRTGPSSGGLAIVPETGNHRAFRRAFAGGGLVVGQRPQPSPSGQRLTCPSCVRRKHTFLIVAALSKRKIVCVIFECMSLRRSSCGF